MEEEYYFICPYCGEKISFTLDLNVSPQSFVEDCEICCSPILVSFEIEDGKVVSFEASTTQ